MPPTSVSGEVYCFPRRQLIFSFGKRVINIISFERSMSSEYIPKSIPYVCPSVPRSSNE